MPDATPAVRARLAEACLELLRIPSVTGQEAELSKHLRRWATSLKQLSRDDVMRHEHALILGQPDDERPCVALVGHLDTVPGHTTDPTPYQSNDRIVGLGASDMKGGLAVMQVLFETLDLGKLPFALMLVLYDREEGPYRDNGLQALLERFDVLGAIDLAICMEPTDNTLQVGCMGSLHARVTFKGQAAHSARPWQGENAIHKAGPLLSQLLHQKPRETLVDGLVFREAVSVTLARGGLSANTVPAELELNVNHRFAPTLPIAAAVDRAINEVKQLAAGAEVEIRDIAPPGPLPQGNPIVDHLRTLAHLSVEPKQAWTDVARLAAHGIDAVNFGPGATSQAHQRGEWVSHAALVSSYEILSQVLSVPLEGTV